MEIYLSCKAENAEQVLQSAMDAINVCAEKTLDWKVERFGKCFNGKTVCYNNETKIEALFDKFLEQFPELDIDASYSFDVREDDYSANWFGYATVKTAVREDGTKYLDKSCGTYWT